MENHFHPHGVALNLTLKQRLGELGNCLSWELNSFLMQTLSFVPTLLHKCWPWEWKRSIEIDLFSLFVLFTQSEWRCQENFPPCLLMNYAYICTWLRGILKDTILSSIITWPTLGKQNILSKQVHWPLCTIKYWLSMFISFQCLRFVEYGTEQHFETLSCSEIFDVCLFSYVF